jgi:hypothetical protein
MTWLTMEDIIQTGEGKNEEKKRRPTAPSQKKSIHTTMKPPP